MRLSRRPADDRSEEEIAAEKARRRIEARKIMLENFKKGRKKPKNKGGRKITPLLFKKAIPGSFGNKSLIAKRLGVSPNALYGAIKVGRIPDKILDLLAIEEERLLDVAESGITYCLKQREDLKTLLNTSRFILLSKGSRRGYMIGKQVHELHGKVEHLVGGVVNIDTLGLTLDERKRLLDKIEHQIDNGGKVVEVEAKLLPAPPDDENTTDAEEVQVADPKQVAFERRKVNPRQRDAV